NLTWQDQRTRKRTRRKVKTARIAAARKAPVRPGRPEVAAMRRGPRIWPARRVMPFTDMKAPRFSVVDAMKIE
ncbi:MAG: hypothetical protein M3Q54_15125, partial [Actinomycetota bacterium]|nr:hypothetical protein [Actinomycetota bacterium]